METYSRCVLTLTLSLNPYEISLLRELLQSRIDEVSELLESKKIETNNPEHLSIISSAKFHNSHYKRILSKISL